MPAPPGWALRRAPPWLLAPFRPACSFAAFVAPVSQPCSASTGPSPPLGPCRPFLPLSCLLCSPCCSPPVSCLPLSPSLPPSRSPHRRRGPRPRRRPSTATPATATGWWSAGAAPRRRWGGRDGGRERERERENGWRSSGWLIPNHSCKIGVPVSRRAWEFLAKRVAQGRVKQLPVQILAGYGRAWEFPAKRVAQGRVRRLPAQILAG